MRAERTEEEGGGGGEKYEDGRVDDSEAEKSQGHDFLLGLLPSLCLLRKSEEAYGAVSEHRQPGVGSLSRVF